MFYDSHRRSILIFDRTDGHTWEWNGDAWSSLSIQGQPPQLDPAAYDDDRHVAVLVGDGYTWELSSTSGDFNHDGAIGVQDLTILLSHFGTPGGALPEDGDLDGDGDVDLTDLTQLLARFGVSC